MVYKNNLVAAVKVGGQVLRESGGNVFIPFGSEYSLLLKNLNSVRVKVKVSIDGTEASDGYIVIRPNSDMELERYILRGNLENGNRFKFIERSAEIEKHRGIKADDGIVRVEYLTEKVTRIEEDVIVRRRYEDYWPCPRPHFPPRNPYRWESSRRIMATGSVATRSLRASASAGSSRKMSMRSDAGITVPGSVSNQRFYATSDFPCQSPSDVLILHLRGEMGGRTVAHAVTVNHKPNCQTCGKSNKPNSQFCAKCGTALMLL